MRNWLSLITVMLVLTAAVASPAAAQDTRIRIQERIENRIVIPGEILAEVRRLIDTAISQDVRDEIRRSLERVATDIRRIPSTIVTPAYGRVYGVEQNREFTTQQTDRQTKTLAIGATGALALRNVVGDITVKTGGGREVTVEIVRVARGRTDADARRGLERVQAEVTTRGERGSVIARYPDERRPPYSVSVAYAVTAPAGTRITIDTITGTVHVAGLQGDLAVTGVSGNVTVSSCARLTKVQTISGEITVSDSQADGRMELGSVGASIRVTNVKADRLTASVVSGAVIAREVQANGASMSTMSGNLEYSGPVSARGRYEFSAHSGDVRLGITGGFDLEASTFSGRVATEPSLGLTSTSARVRSLRGAVAGGGAAVIARTFSGSVWVGRKL